MRARGAYQVLAVVVVSALALPTTGAQESTEERTVNIFYLGDSFAYAVTPYFPLRDEPPFRLTAVPTYSLDLLRAMRHYLPRTYQDYVDSHDVLLLSDTVRSYYQPAILEIFKRGVMEGGQGILMVGGYGSFGAMVGLPSWEGSPVADVLPCISLDQRAYDGLGSLFPVPVDPDHEFCKPLPWERVPGFLGMNTVVPKEGSVQILRPVANLGVADGPVLVYWETGAGTGLAHTPDLTYGWVGPFQEWEFYGDYCVNLIYLLYRLGVPQDTALVHAARNAMYAFAQERALLIGMAEFVDRFGANPRPIEQGVAEIAKLKAAADVLYMDQDFLGALGKLTEIRLEVRRLGEEAIKLKDRALLWVYVSEWLAVTATLMVTGYVVWSLMVRRGLYRDVQITRLRGDQLG